MISEKPAFTHSDYEITGRTVLYEGRFCYVRYNLKHRLFKGGWTPVLERELMERSCAAAILPYDPILDKVVLINQFRPGAMQTSTMKNQAATPLESPWVTEIVAGVLDTAESPAEVAKREAVEEAGCPILDLYPLGDYFVSPGGSNEYIHIYCGRIDVKEQSGHFGLEEENEDIFAFSLSADEAFEWIRQGKIKTAPAIIALQWLQINRNFLRDSWLR